jgi:hypothetical protein
VAAVPIASQTRIKKKIFFAAGDRSIQELPEVLTVLSSGTINVMQPAAVRSLTGKVENDRFSETSANQFHHDTTLLSHQIRGKLYLETAIKS